MLITLLCRVSQPIQVCFWFYVLSNYALNSDVLEFVVQPKMMKIYCIRWLKCHAFKSIEH